MEEKEINLVGRMVAFATPKADGNLFWQTGRFESQTNTHFFIRINGLLTGFLKSSVLKIEVKEVA